MVNNLLSGGSDAGAQGEHGVELSANSSVLWKVSPWPTVVTQSSPTFSEAPATTSPMLSSLSALGGRACVYPGGAARQVGDALGELLAVVVAGGLLRLALDGLGARPDVLLGAVLADLHLLAAAQVAGADVLQVDAQVLEDGLAARQGGDVFERGLGAAAGAGRLGGARTERVLTLITWCWRIIGAAEVASKCSL
jgi:hypothetical protein